MRKLVSFCIRVLPQPMAISGMLQTTLVTKILDKLSIPGHC
jgi:hypothetical protein